MRVLTSLSLICVVSVVGCSDDSDKLPIGSTCDEPAECQGGLCVQSTCIDPFGCADVFSAGEPAGVVEACLAGLQTLTVTPNPATGQPGGQLQFTARGTFGSGGTDIPDTEVIGGAREGALTLSAAADLTAVATWTSDSMVMFDNGPEGTRGLAQISPNGGGRHYIRATIGEGFDVGRIVYGEAILDVAIGTDVPR